MTERLGAARAVILGAGGLCPGALAMASLPPCLGVQGFALAFALLAIGYQVVQAALATRVMAEARAEDQGVTAGVLTLSRNIGFVLGASGMSALFAILSRQFEARTDPSMAAHVSMAVTFAAATVLAFLVLGLAKRLQRINVRPRP
ncbi:MAG: hypothetical protein AAGI09_06670 [Pseudomonadota bacterium]